MATVGQSVREIRVRNADGAYRVIYLATMADAVYVLHCFQKKSAQTSNSDIRLARQRFRNLMKERT